MPRDKDKTLWELEEELAADYAMSAPLEELEADLERRGIDPAKIAARARELARSRGVDAEPGWRSQARERLAAARDKIKRVASDYAGLTRDQLLARLAELRNHPSLGSPVVAAFRKRSPSESSDDELREILADMETLIAIAEDDLEPGD